MENIKVAICESEQSDKVVKFMNLTDFTPDFIQAHDNGNIWGVYWEGGEIVAQDIWQKIHKDILND